MANLGAVRDKDYIPPNIRAYAEAHNLDPGQVKAALALGMMTDPTIQAQYKDDPRTQLGLKAIEAGSDMSPLKGGIAEGLARVAQGFLGGRISRDQRALYTDKQRLQSQDMQSAIDKMNGNPAATVASALTTMPTAPGTDVFQPSGMVKGVAQPGIPHPTEAPASGGGNFESYKSADYGPLEEKYAAQYGIPVELLQAVRLHGEKSNASQVSPAGAKTVYQFTPSTRRLFKKAYGVDAYASPEDAVHAAALHLRDDYKKTGGDVKETLTRYIAGPSGQGRGPQTQAYAARTLAAVTGGSAASAPQAGSGISPVNTAAPPQVVVPDMPTPMAQPERPTLHKQIQSVRMQLVNNLLGGELAKLDPTLNMLSVDKYLPGALTEEQDIRKQREVDEVDLAKSEYTSQLGRWSHQQDAAFDAGVKARETAQGLKNDYQKIGYQDQLGDANRQSEQTFTHNENEANRQNTLDVANARASGKGLHVPSSIIKDYGHARSAITKIDQTLSLVGKHPGATGFIAGLLPGYALNNWWDPSGKITRAGIADIGSIVVKERSGTAVTAAEEPRLLPFIPKVGDSQAEVQDKLSHMKTFLEDDTNTWDTMYPNAEEFAPFQEGASNKSAAAPAAAPGKFAPDAKGHRGTLKL